MFIITVTLLAAILLAIEGMRKLRRSQSTLLPLPPGPKPLPIIGNVLGMNKDAPHLTYTQWSKIYGDIVFTQVLGQNIIILNSQEVAITLLEKRSHKYSNRPVMSIVNMFGLGGSTTLQQYGPTFRLHRRLLYRAFHARAALGYRPRQLRKAYEMLAHMLDDPACYAEHFITFAAAVVVEVTFGYNVKGAETFLTSMRRVIDIVVPLTTPEISAICSTFPFVKSLPAWFPGMAFKAEAPECRRLVSQAFDEPYEWVKQRLSEGHAVPSMVSDAIARYRLDDDSSNPRVVRAIKDSAGTLYSASVETTRATLLVFVYLMMNNQEIQHRAQKEIDSAVGRQRLPVFEDRPSLSYIDAILRETMRWHPVAPFAIPHATSEDDVYQGFHIPKGSTIVANLWAISRNEIEYPNPDVFMPERFLMDDGALNKDNIPWSFGFGRRICPGRNVADASLWSAMVCILVLFKIEKSEGSDDVKWSTGLTSYPLPFPCKFVPREQDMDSEKLASLMYASRVDML